MGKNQGVALGIEKEIRTPMWMKKTDRTTAISLNIISLFMALCGINFLLYSIYIPVYKAGGIGPVWSSLIWFFILFAAIAIFFKNHPAVYPILGLVVAFAIWRIRFKVYAGFSMVVRAIATQVAEYYEIDVDVSGLVSDASVDRGVETLFIVIGAVWVLLLLLINAKKFRGFLSFILIVPFIIMVLLIGVDLDSINIIYMALYILVPLVLGLGNIRRKTSWKVAIPAGIGVLVFVSIFAIYTIILPKNFYKSDFIENIKTTVNNRVTEVVDIITGKSEYKVGAIGGAYFNGLKSRVGDVDKITPSDEAEIIIDYVGYDGYEDYTGMEAELPPDKVYLKGFSGVYFDNNTWTGEREREDDYSELNPGKAYRYLSLARNYFYGDYYSNVMKVTKLKKTNIVYEPYFTQDGSFGYNGMYFKGGAYHYDGNPYAVFNVSYGKQGEVQQYDYLTDIIHEEYGILGFSSLYIDDLVSSYKSSGEDEHLLYTEPNEDYLNVPNEKEMPKFHKEFKHMYITVDGKVVDLKGRGYDSEIGLVPCVDYVRNYLKQCEYTLSPGKVPRGKNVVDYFLFDSKKGYCMYYATAATMMFRQMGIPARYCEGYMVDIPDEAKNEGVVYGKNSDLHAWTEIYAPNIGWIPVEVTFGSGQNVRESSQAIIPETESSTQNTETTTKKEEITTEKDSEKESETESEVDETKSNETDMENGSLLNKDKNKNKNNLGKVAWRVVRFAIIVIIIIAVIVIILNIRRKTFRLSIYEKDICRILKLLGYDISVGKNRRDNIEIISKGIDIDSLEIKKIYDVLDKLEYSNTNRIMPSERRALKKSILMIGKKSKEKVSKFKRIYIDFIIDRYR